MKKPFILNIFLIGLLLLCILFPDGLFAEGKESKSDIEKKETPTVIPPVEGAIESVVNEPVFGGDAYIYQAGVENPISVVLVHGIGDDLACRVWGNLIPALSKKYHVITFDLPGFGKSTKKNIQYTPALYTDFIKWVVDIYVKDSFVLIGHSMGGALSLRYAAFYPQNISKLILVNAAGILHRIAFTQYAVRIKPAQSASWLRKVSSSMVNSLTLSVLEDIEHDDTTEDLQKILDSPTLRKTILGGNPSKIAGTALMLEDYSEIIEMVTVPTLIIWSTNDLAAPLRTGKVLRSLIPNSRLEIISQCGHVPMLQQPEQFNDLVLEEMNRSNEESGETHTAPSGYCNEQKGMVFTGDYRKIMINNCSKVQIINVDTGLIEISGSDVMIENSRIKGNSTALTVTDSEVIITAVKVEADTAMSISNSTLDLAGVELIGEKAAAVTNDSAELLFSVSRARSPFTSGHLHGKYRLTPENPI